jgi:hypothetical protein
MGSFQTKNPNLGKFCRALDWKMLPLWPFGIFDRHLGYFMTIWYIVCSFVLFVRFWYIVSRKIWQPCSAPSRLPIKTPEVTKYEKNLTLQTFRSFEWA